MANVAYWAVVCAGAATLIIEADRQFRRPVQIDSLMKYSILADVEATTFSVRAERFRGHAFYILCYLVVYAAVLASVQLQQLLLQTGSGQKQAGSNFEDEISTLLFNDTNYALPLVVSAAIISTLSLPVAEKFEQVIRGIAHYLAGIPGGFHQTMDRVTSQLKKEIKKGSAQKKPGRLTYLLKSKIEKANPSGIESWDQRDRYEEVLKYTRIIDILYPFVAGESGARFWPAGNAAKLTDLFKKVENRYKTVLDLAGKASNKAMFESPEYWDQIEQAAADARDNMQAAFALFCVVNSQTYIPDDGSFASRLLVDVRTEARKDTLKNVTIWCAILIVVISFLFATGLSIAFEAPWASAAVDVQAISTRAGWQGLYVAGRMVCLLALPALLCLAVRDAMMRLHRWEPWDGTSLPPGYLYLRGSIIPVAVSAFLLVWWIVIYWTFRQVMTGNWVALTGRNVADVVRFSYAQEMALIPLAFIVCFFVFMISDKSFDYVSKVKSQEDEMESRRILREFRNRLVQLVAVFSVLFFVFSFIAIAATTQVNFRQDATAILVYYTREFLLLYVPIFLFIGMFSFLVFRDSVAAGRAAATA